MRLNKPIVILFLCIILATVCACSSSEKLSSSNGSSLAFNGNSSITYTDSDSIYESSLMDSQTAGNTSSGITQPDETSSVKAISGSASTVNSNLLEKIKNKYANATPLQWSDKTDGVILDIKTNDPVIALTFDACGGGTGNGYDRDLIDFLIKEKIPATLFINARWIDSNMVTFLALAKNPLFEIENHGFEHKPLSINGKSAYDIKGTASMEEVYNEVYRNEQKILELTGRKPLFFRSGTAFYDEISVKIVNDLGEKPVNFTIAGDAGATYNVKQIQLTAQRAKNGSILLYHMNHPEKSTAEGIIASIPMLRDKGFRFVKLEDYIR